MRLSMTSSFQLLTYCGWSSGRSESTPRMTMNSSGEDSPLSLITPAGFSTPYCLLRLDQCLATSGETKTSPGFGVWSRPGGGGSSLGRSVARSRRIIG